MPLDFSVMRAALRTISEAIGDGYLISCVWDGSLMRVSVGRRADPFDWRKPWVMTFDSDADYSADPAKLIADLSHEVKIWFGLPKDHADEIVRLLQLAENRTTAGMPYPVAKGPQWDTRSEKTKTDQC